MDEAALVEFYAHAQSLRRLIEYAIGDSCKAEDVLQSAVTDFLVRVRAGTRIDDPKAYFASILRHRIGDAVRERASAPSQMPESDRRGGEGDALQYDPPSSDPSPEAQLLNKERRGQFVRARMKLREIDQEIIVRHLDDEPGVETQRALSITATQYRLRKSRAKQALKGIISRAA